MSFKDTFTKNQNEEEILGYDDTAFYYFAGSVLLVVAIPWTLNMLYNILFPGESELEQKFPKKVRKTGSKYKYCTTSRMVEKQDEGRREARACTKSGMLGLGARVTILTLMWIGVYAVVVTIGNSKEIATFDPFAILEVTSSATDKEIKRAYHKLSLKFHPDKNPDDPLAASRFIQITKAYSSLTDEVAKSNYEKYGNPDGPTQAKVGIGLPHFLLEKDNHLIILSFFFGILLFVVPGLAICYYQRTKEYAPNGVMIETLQFLGYHVSEATRAKQCSELLAASAEARCMELRESDNTALTALMAEVTEHTKRKWPKYPAVYKADVLLLAHMQRLHHLLTPDMLTDLNVILGSAIKITQSMMEIACAREWLGTAQAMIEFRCRLIQAVDIKSSQLMQVPHFTDESIRQHQKGKNSVDSIEKFLAQEASERKGVADMNPQQLLDVQAFCDHVSSYEFHGKVEVEDEADMVVGDVATVTATLTRTGLKEGEAAGPVHAPFFPDTKFEEWWVFLLEAGATQRMLGFDRIRDPERVAEVKLRFQIPRPGKHSYVLHAFCDSYIGVDKKFDLKFVAKTEDEVKREIIIHKEDEDLELVPTLFQQMMGELNKDEDSDEEEEDDKKPGKAPLAESKEALAAEKKDNDSESGSSSSSDSSDSD